MVERNLSFGFLSSFPPTQCGMATFTTALGSALVGQHSQVHVVRVLDEPEISPPSRLPVVGELVASDSSSYIRAARALNFNDVALIQHEYGLYGGLDGADIMKVLDRLTIPAIAILHTVLPRPTRHQVEVLNRVIEAASAVVVMTDRAQQTLMDIFTVRDDDVRVIPHGATIFNSPPSRPTQRPTLLTWGLIGPGKGIEWVIGAMARLKDLDPKPLYIVAGKTHPKVLTKSGDQYRKFLEQLVVDCGVEEMVVFDNSYHDLAALGLLIESVDVVVLPYDSKDQATSGVLVDAIAAGRPVIATAFPHAVELLRSGAGIVVAQRDVVGLSQALRRVFTEPHCATSMATEARRLAPGLGWDAVGEQFQTLATQVLSSVEVDA